MFRAKNVVSYLTILLFLSISSNCLAQTFKKGDVNHDGTVDISDVVAVINTIAGNNTYKDTADVNKDTVTDISDVVAIINIIAGGSSQGEINIQLSDLTKIIFNDNVMSVVNGDKTTNYTIEGEIEMHLVNPGANAGRKFLDIYSQGKIVASLTFKDADKLSFGENGSLIIWLKDEVIYQTNSKVDNILVYDKSQEPLVYLGIIGFNQDLYIQPFGILAKNTADTFNSFVNNLTYRDGTILYYAVDNALDMLANFGLSTSLSSVNLITFTDGLDQGSLMMTSNYSTETAYLNALSGRIGNMKVAGLPLTAYSLGLRGNDVSDNTMYTTNLRKLASSADKATEVSSIYDVESQLQGIADQIISVSTRKNISVRIPGPATGTTVRFVFDGKSPETSSLYIEGVFNMNDMSLTKMYYHGFKTTSGTVVGGTRDGIFVTFSFKGLQLSDGNGQFSTSNIRQYNKAPNSTTWQVNSEFSPESNVQTTVTYSGCAIMLVLDCSRSLGSDFSRMQSYVRNFIDKIARNTADFQVLAPTGVSAKLTDSGGQLGVRLSWIASKHADSYIIYRSSSASGSYTKIADNITSPTWKDVSPLPGMNYYKVVAVGSGLQSEHSSFTSVNFQLSPPMNLSAKLSETEGVVLFWRPSQYAQSYIIYRSSNSSGSFGVVAEGVTSTTWSDTSPLSGTNYYKVATVGYGMVSEKSQYTYVDFSIAPPVNLSSSMAERNGKLIVDLSWSASPNAQNYMVCRSSSSSGIYNVVAEGVTSTSWTDLSPLPGFNYYKVASVGLGMVSEKSSYAYVDFTIAPPTNLSAYMTERNGEQVVDLSWTKSSSPYAQNYTVYRSSSSSGTYSVVADGLTSTSWTDLSPLLGFNYYKVAASGYGLTGERSYTISMHTVSKTFTIKGVTFNMVTVEGGTFLMGSNGSQSYSSEQPIHQVTLSTFSIGQTEVTQELWEAVMGTNSSYYKGVKLPVEQVSWNDCQTFITRLNSLTGMQFRLPTEAEWEYSARGGNQSKGYKYSGSNNIGDVAWCDSNSSNTHEVATKEPNELGIYDMSGNVWEWCQDWYGSYSSSSWTNPTGPSSGSNRVLRGGSWDYDARHCRVAYRSGFTPDRRSFNLGLRLAL